MLANQGTTVLTLFSGNLENVSFVSKYVLECWIKYSVTGNIY
jgi:hypothetical protein